jgi:saccharopine dehydrogenase (NADP+, L-glutamate forming)
MPTIHWLGAGLSSVPGIRRLAGLGHHLVLWNRTLAKAEAALQGDFKNAQASELNWEALERSVAAGDVVVSMLPATMHIPVAEICLRKKAHFVSSSYVSPEMQALSQQAAAAELSFVNEAGLDPGIDHLLAHKLMAEYSSSSQFDDQKQHYFRSYCGGFPKHPNSFRYKFSWSPLGVLRALKSKAQWIDNGETRATDKPWKALSTYAARFVDREETFQAYPNRDSLPFLTEYGLNRDWNILQFVRGTLRLNGWADAWSEIFALIESADGEAGQSTLVSKSEELWRKYRYDEGEPDRVVLCVELEVRDHNRPVWHRAYSIDASGDARGSAMSRLVSLTTSIAVDSVLDSRLEPGVMGAPKDPVIVNEWLERLESLGERYDQVIVV